MIKKSDKIVGDVRGKFQINLDRSEDDYLAIFFDKETKTDNYYMSENADKIINMLLTLYFHGNSSIKVVLGNFVSNVVIMETKMNFQNQQNSEIEHSIISENLKIN